MPFIHSPQQVLVHSLCLLSAAYKTKLNGSLSLAAAVEYQRRVTLNPRQKRSTAVKVLKVTATAVEVVGVQSDGSS